MCVREEAQACAKDVGMIFLSGQVGHLTAYRTPVLGALQSLLASPSPGASTLTPVAPWPKVAPSSYKSAIPPTQIALFHFLGQ